MGKSIALILQARKNSKRCKNKMVRKFHNTNLFEIALNKLNKIKNIDFLKIYIAVGENIFFQKLSKYDFEIINRNSQSVLGDKIDDVYNYLHKVKEDYIIFFNPCAPMLKISTLKSAINLFQRSTFKSLTTVVKKHTWYFDDNHKPINDNSSGNTKDLKPIYECTHNFHIFNKNFFLMNHTYWSNKKNDPFLFEVNQEESFDIDTEEEFKLAKKIYSANF